MTSTFFTIYVGELLRVHLSAHHCWKLMPAAALADLAALLALLLSADLLYLLLYYIYLI